jgi:hypothetical protein
MNYVVKLYDLRGFMFAYTVFKKQADARKYASNFKRHGILVESDPKHEGVLVVRFAQ